MARASAGTSRVTVVPVADVGAFAHGHGRDELRVAADERALADGRRVLLEAVVVAEDRARADVGARADDAVAQVGEVIGLGAPAHAGLLGLDEVADVRLFAQSLSGRR